MKVFTGVVVVAVAAALGACASGGRNSPGVEVAGETVTQVPEQTPRQAALPASEPQDQPALDLARAFTGEIAAGNAAGAFDRHFEFDHALDRMFSNDAALARWRGEARAKLRDILVWTYPRPTGATPYSGFTVAGTQDGATLVRYTVSPGGGEADFTETIAIRENGGGLAVTDVHIMRDFWFTQYLRKLHHISGHDEMKFLRGFHAAAALHR